MSARVTELSCTSLPLSGTGEETAAWAASVLDSAGMTADALYVATSDGGAREALAFWAAAQGTGLAFANPRAFPWTLANSATGRISQVLGINGPCTTYVGAAEAFAAAGQDAEDDVAAGLVTSALVVSLQGQDPILPEGGPVRVSLVARRVG
jgi:3-oxoacyl-(acyl-carrier-protein) synthase